MIYDYLDISTKYYISSSVRNWVRTGNNAVIILQNPKIREITEADLSGNSEDDIVWTVLYLIGVGLFRYFVKSTVNEESFDIGMKPHWEKPKWLYDLICRTNMKSHIDVMMEHEQEVSKTGIPAVGLQASLDIISYRQKCLERPRVPNRDPEKEIELIQSNRNLFAAKRQFHRGL